jgi:hypothetical protein
MGDRQRNLPGFGFVVKCEMQNWYIGDTRGREVRSSSVARGLAIRPPDLGKHGVDNDRAHHRIANFSLAELKDDPDKLVTARQAGMLFDEYAADVTNGKLKEMVEPLPGVLVTQICPPCAATISLERWSPRLPMPT